MSRRFWIVAAMFAALTIGTFTPQQAEAGWRRRYYGGGHRHAWRRAYAFRGGFGWRRGYAWRRGWGGWAGFGGGWGGGFGGGWGGGGWGGGGGYGSGGYGVCSTDFGFDGSNIAGVGASYGTPYVSSYSMPLYANNTSLSPYLAVAYNTTPVVNTVRIDTASSTVASSPAIGFAARYTALIKNANTPRSKVGTSFLASHSSIVEQAKEPVPAAQSEATRSNGYGYGLASGSGYSYKSSYANTPQGLSNFGLGNIAMNR